MNIVLNAVFRLFGCLVFICILMPLNLRLLNSLSWNSDGDLLLVLIMKTVYFYIYSNWIIALIKRRKKLHAVTNKMHGDEKETIKNNWQETRDVYFICFYDRQSSEMCKTFRIYVRERRNSFRIETSRPNNRLNIRVYIYWCHENLHSSLTTNPTKLKLKFWMNGKSFGCLMRARLQLYDYLLATVRYIE